MGHDPIGEASEINLGGQESPEATKIALALRAQNRSVWLHTERIFGHSREFNEPLWAGREKSRSDGASVSPPLRSGVKARPLGQRHLTSGSKLHDVLDLLTAQKRPDLGPRSRGAPARSRAGG